MSSYNSNDLSPEAKERYRKKLQLCKLEKCPYLLPADAWKNDPTEWPNLEYPEIYDYLINSPGGVFTRESLKDRKSLEAHNQFISGWVRDVLHHFPCEDFIVFKADVLSPQCLNDDCCVVWIVVSLSSCSVTSAHCTCVTGLDESCTHVGALLFKIETVVRLGYSEQANKERSQWNGEYEETRGKTIAEINFYDSSETPSLDGSDDDEQFNVRPPTEEEKQAFLLALSKCDPPPVCLSLFPEKYYKK